MNDQTININMPVLKNLNAKLMKNKLQNVVYYGIVLSRLLLKTWKTKLPCVLIYSYAI